MSPFVFAAASDEASISALEEALQRTVKPQLSQLLSTLSCPTLASLLKDEAIHDTVKNTALIMLHLSCPSNEAKENIKKLASVPVEHFKSREDLHFYIDSILISGVDKTVRGMLCVLGNTDVGKTSLMRAVKQFSEKGCVSETTLTGDPKNHQFLKTEVLDVISNVTMKVTTDEDVSLESNSSDVLIARFNKTKGNPLGSKELKASVYDFAGHSEYFISSSLFMKDRGAFIVAFNGEDMLRTQSGDEISSGKYHQTIGTFVEMIVGNCENPCIQLVATKMDSETTDERKLWDNILTRVKDHLDILISSDTRQAVLAGEILNTSAKNVLNIAPIERLVSRSTLLLLNERVNTRQSGTPKLWASLVSGHSSLKVKISELEGKLDELQAQASTDEIDPSQDQLLNNLREVLKIWPIHFAGGQRHTQQLNRIKQQHDSEVPKEYQDPVNPTERQVPQDFENVTATPSQDQEVEPSANLSLVLSYLDTIGNILWFKKKEGLKDFIIPEPMKLISVLKCIVNHNTEHNLEKALQTGQIERSSVEDLRHRGILTFAALTTLYQMNKQAFSEHDVKFFLEHLGLIISCQKGFFFVPSLISNAKEDELKEDIQELKLDPKTYQKIFLLRKSSKDSQLFQQIIPKLASDRRIELVSAYAKKIEHQDIGEVAAMKGVILEDYVSDFKLEFAVVDVEFRPSKPGNQTFYATHKVSYFSGGER